ncbi:MAG: hypothetical protein V4592_01010 [Bacteroidota bacterium]
MKKITLLILLGIVSFKSFCQYLPADMKAGLKGNLLYVATTSYYNHPKDISARDIQVFDRQGLFIKYIMYDTANKVQTDFTFQYDRSGRLLSYKEYKEKIMQAKTVNVYDNYDRVVLQNIYLYSYGYPNSHFKLKKCTYKYNKAGLPVEVYVDQYGIDIRPYREYFSYNAKGQRITDLREPFAMTPGHMNTYTYNKHGDMIQRITTSSESDSYSDTTRYEYNGYDNAGNWHQKKEFHLIDGIKEARDVTIRKITYFKK